MSISSDIFGESQFKMNRTQARTAQHHIRKLVKYNSLTKPSRLDKVEFEMIGNRAFFSVKVTSDILDTFSIFLVGPRGGVQVKHHDHRAI